MPTPSLIIPSAPVYDEGLLYGLNVYGTNFVPDPIPFTRATTATRTNAAGLLELAPYNLLTWSEQFDNAAWIKALASVTPNVATAPNGTLTADKIIASVSAGGSHFIYQLNTTSTTSPFVWSCYAKASEYNRFGLRASSSSIIFDLSNGTIVNQTGLTTASIQSVGNGWYLCQMITTQTNIGNFQLCAISNTSTVFDFPGDGVSGVFIWGAQLVEGTSALPYLKTETRLNIPRVDFSLGGCPNLLLEPQRTNLALQSSSFDNASWLKAGGSVVTANTTISPSGVQDADSIFTTTGNAIVVQIRTVTSGATHSLSFYAKQDTHRFVYLRLVTTANNYISVVYDLLNGTVGETSVGSSSGTLVSATITPAANGFYRVALVGAVAGTDLNIGIGFAIAITGNTFSNVGTITNFIGSGNSFFIWGAQLEAGAYATSFIPTTTASVTRNQDVVIKTGISSLIGQTQGTLFLEARSFNFLGNGFGERISLTDGTFNNRVNIDLFPGGSVQMVLANSTTGLNGTITATGTGLTNNSKFKIAVAYDGANSRLYVNGTAYTTIVGTMPTFSGQLSVVEFNQGNTARPFFGRVEKLTVYPERLTNAELATLTTL